MVVWPLLIGIRLIFWLVEVLLSSLHISIQISVSLALVGASLRTVREEVVVQLGINILRSLGLAITLLLFLFILVYGSGRWGMSL